MIAEKKKFYGGWIMLIVFVIVLVIFFSPVFNGKNGLDYLDNLYNSISKGSAYYIPSVKDEIESFMGKKVDLSIYLSDEEHAQQAALLFKMGGANAVVSGPTLTVSGDIGMILINCLEDADLMYHNNGKSISEKYGYGERNVMYNWWKVLKAADFELKKQKMFNVANISSRVNKKAVEMAYNYYQIEPKKISEAFWVIILSLVFYVVYTIWYGFAYMFIFEGWGLKLDH